VDGTALKSVLTQLWCNPECIYKGPLKNGQPTGRGQQVNPDGIIWTGDFTNGFGSTGRWQQTDPEGRVTDVTLEVNGDEVEQTNDAFVSGRYENIDKRTLKEGLPTGPGVFEARAGSSFGASGSRFEGEFQEGILHAHGKKVYDNGDVEEGDFKDGQFAGKVLFPNGDWYEGQFEGDKLISGNARITGTDGSVYVGSVMNGGIEGHGTYTRPDGSTHAGDIRASEAGSEDHMTIQADHGPVIEGHGPYDHMTYVTRHRR